MTVNADQLMNEIVHILDDKKAHQIVALDVQGISLVTDYFIICHGNSDTQVRSLTEFVRKGANERGITVKGIEGANTGRWVLIDLGDVVVHIFHREEREYYNLERIWSDAKTVEWA